MYARILAGPHSTGKPETKNPTWEQIENAIRRMDRQELSLVLLGHAKDSPYMAIGGGYDEERETNPQLFICCVTDPDLSNHTLIDPSKGVEQVYVVTGGQEGDFPARMAVSLELVLRAARAFAERGELTPSLHWVHD